MTNCNCLVCEKKIKSFMSFGPMPIANGFLSQEEFKNEYFFDMEVAFCDNCKMFQLVNQPDREQMFHDNYAFFASTSQYMKTHFENLANDIIDNWIITDDPFVVEIGSNDGIMLENFSNKKIRHLGIDPSANVAEVARKKGINTIAEFFDESLASKIIDKEGKADIFMGSNVMCHIPYIKSIVKGIKTLIKKDGVAIFEDPYLGNVIEKTTFDQIYDEHTFLFSATSVKNLFELFDMELIHLEPLETHGGSMRYFVANKGERNKSKEVSKYLQKEEEMGLTKPETFDKFRDDCEDFKKTLFNLLEKIKSEGKTIVGYAATSKSTTIMNYCGITNEHIDYICDTTPIKWSKFSPGVHVPIKSHEDFASNYPDYALLFGYNHEKEIMAKEKDFTSSNSKWIVYVPEIKILE